jgi:hypothetical protein
MAKDLAHYGKRYVTSSNATVRSNHWLVVEQVVAKG